jgi:hypothetical protein
MAKSEAIMPSWAATVGAMRDHGTKVAAYCGHCRIQRAVDPAKLAAIKGDDYSLVDRRCRCKFTPECPGWITFHYLHGVMRPLRTDAYDRRVYGLPPRPSRHRF